MGAAKIWDLGAQCGAYILGRHLTLSDSVAATPDGRWVASAERGGRVVLWDIETGDALAHMQADTSRVYRLEFNPSGTLLAGACHDGSLRVWSVPDGRPRARVSGRGGSSCTCSGAPMRTS